MTVEAPEPAGREDGPAPDSTAEESAPPSGPEQGDVLQARWSEVLDHLENDVVAAEQVLARNRAEEIAAWSSRSGDWVPPSSLGPLPDELRARAARLLQHQLEVAERLVERITQSQRQRDLTARMRFASKPVPAYFDEAI
jgi:hypothetical protein